jgi:hypothetical protein
MARLLAPLLLLASAACAPRYYCGPGTHAEGEWCLVDEAGSGRPGSDTSGDTSTDSAGETSTDSGDTSLDTSGDTSADTGEPPAPARLVINELMASNSERAADEYGEFDDWVEIYNAGGEPMPLDGLALTDTRDQPALYQFPAGSVLEAGEWRVVWCDGQPEQGPDHAAFTLQSAADQVYLVRDPEGLDDVVDAVTYADFPREQSAIRWPDGSETWVYTDNVTPGAANSE